MITPFEVENMIVSRVMSKLKSPNKGDAVISDIHKSTNIVLRTTIGGQTVKSFSDNIRPILITIRREVVNNL